MREIKLDPNGNCPHNTKPEWCSICMGMTNFENQTRFYGGNLGFKRTEKIRVNKSKKPTAWDKEERDHRNRIVDTTPESRRQRAIQRIRELKVEEKTEMENDPLEGIPFEKDNRGYCAIDDCKENKRGVPIKLTRKLCTNHYQQWRKGCIEHPIEGKYVRVKPPTTKRKGKEELKIMEEPKIVRGPYENKGDESGLIPIYRKQLKIVKRLAEAMSLLGMKMQVAEETMAYLKEFIDEHAQ